MNKVATPKRLRLAYTTYDIRRDEDSLSTMGGGNVMTLLHDGEHPFWYTHILRAFQISVCYIGRHSKDWLLHKMDMLWVQWLGVKPNYHWSFKHAQLPKVGFVPDTNEDLVFAFLGPSSVI